MSPTRRPPAAALFALFLAGVSFTASGCQSSQCGGGPGLLSGVSGGGRRGARGGFGPAAPGSGSRFSDPTPTLGSLGGRAATRPPQLTGPAAPVSFGSNVQAILNKYNATIDGADVNDQTVQRALNALQLYKGRNHTLAIHIERDDSKMPISALWSGSSDGAEINFWQPDLQHTIDHEVAHDMTLAAMPAEGQRLWDAIASNANDDGTWPSGYSQSNESEAKAEILSFLAAIYAKLPIDEQPYDSFNPVTDIQRAAQVFMADNVAAAAPR